MTTYYGIVGGRTGSQRSPLATTIHREIICVCNAVRRRIDSICCLPTDGLERCLAVSARKPLYVTRRLAWLWKPRRLSLRSRRNSAKLWRYARLVRPAALHCRRIKGAALICVKRRVTSLDVIGAQRGRRTSSGNKRAVLHTLQQRILTYFRSRSQQVCRTEYTAIWSTLFTKQ